jgi:predicted phosphodiesterase
MKFAVLGDIHGNLEALNAVLEDARANEVQSYVSTGDIVGYNANPSECLALIRQLNTVSVCGNHDHYCSHSISLSDFHPLAANVMDWTRAHLADADIAYLKSLRLVRLVSGFALVHSTLDMPDKWGYVFDELEAESNFNYQSTTVCFYGHTHHPAVFEKSGGVRRLEPGVTKIMLGKKYFINSGSVGQPRDGDPRASYVIYDVEARQVTFRRVDYDFTLTQQKILDAGLPERLAQRLALGM